MLMASTHTPISPWTVIKSDNKKKARLNCIRHILNGIDYVKNQKMSQIFKIDRKILINGAVEIEKMKEKNEKMRDKMNLNDFDITTHSGLYISKDEHPILEKIYC